MHPNKTFCCSIRAFLLSLLSFNSTSNSLLWSRLSFSPISSSVCLSSSLRVEGPLGPTPLTSDSTSDSSTRTLLFDLLPFPMVLRIFLLQTQTPPETVQMTFQKSIGRRIFVKLLRLARCNTSCGVCIGHMHGHHWSQPLAQPILDISSMQWRIKTQDLQFSLPQGMAPATSLASTSPVPNCIAENTSQLPKQKPLKNLDTYLRNLRLYQHYHNATCLHCRILI